MIKKRKIKRPQSGFVSWSLEEFERFANKQSEKSCMTCAACIPIGGGDHICDATGLAVRVIDHYMPTKHYMWCNGSVWVGR